MWSPNTPNWRSLRACFWVKGSANSRFSPSETETTWPLLSRIELEPVCVGSGGLNMHYWICIGICRLNMHWYLNIEHALLYEDWIWMNAKLNMYWYMKIGYALSKLHTFHPPPGAARPPHSSLSTLTHSHPHAHPFPPFSNTAIHTHTHTHTSVLTHTHAHPQRTSKLHTFHPQPGAARPPHHSRRWSSSWRAWKTVCTPHRFGATAEPQSRPNRRIPGEMIGGLGSCLRFSTIVWFASGQVDDGYIWFSQSRPRCPIPRETIGGLRTLFENFKYCLFWY